MLSRFITGGRAAKALVCASRNQTTLAAAQVTILPNGVRVVSEATGHETATVGIFIDAGSRFECDRTNGVAHFLEHMAFKGTEKRSQRSLEVEIENMGGHLNAYTSREATTYYAKVMKHNVPNAIEILSDILGNSTFPAYVMKKERGVILREMEEVNKMMDEVVFDHLHTTAFQGGPLARPILGPVKNVESITRDDLLDYVKKNYTADRIVLCAAGGVSHVELVEQAHKHFSKFPAPTSKIVVEPPTFTGSDLRVRDDDIPLAHVGIAFESVGLTHPHYYPLTVASTLVGSWDRSFGASKNLASPLAQTVMQDHSCHGYMSFHTCYSDTGLWGCYMSADRMRIDDVVFEVQNEWMRVCTNASDAEINRAKNMLKTATLSRLDGTTPLCEDIGRQMLNFGRRVPPAETEARIDAVTPDEVRRVLMETIYDKCPAVVGVGPIEALQDYNRIRSGQFWLRV